LTAPSRGGYTPAEREDHMTIRVYNCPRGAYSYAPVFWDVKKVNKTSIVLHDGSELPKNLTAKVEILSIFDPDGSYDERKGFLSQLGIDLTELHIKMNDDQFHTLDCLNFI
jgi:hypothetical protein